VKLKLFLNHWSSFDPFRSTRIMTATTNPWDAQWNSSPNTCHGGSLSWQARTIVARCPLKMSPMSIKNLTELLLPNVYLLTNKSYPWRHCGQSFLCHDNDRLKWLPVRLSECRSFMTACLQLLLLHKITSVSKAIRGHVMSLDKGSLVQMVASPGYNNNPKLTS